MKLWWRCKGSPWCCLPTAALVIDIEDFTRLGLDPKAFKIIVVKSGYLSPELAPIANPSLMALSDGAINQDIVHLPANRYRRPSYPFVANLTFTPKVYGSGRNRH